MTKFRCQPRLVAKVRQFHNGMQARVQNDGKYSEPFSGDGRGQTGLFYGTNTVQHDNFCGHSEETDFGQTIPPQFSVRT